MSLTAADFPAYFQAVHRHPPFAWQCRLLAEVLAAGWTRPIALPTASGKTAVLDIAVFALACEASAAIRHTPRRIALVVDRRIVVDDAHARARRIRDRLADGTDAVLVQVREALRSLGGESPLDAVALRGGIYREDRWARTPLQPVLLCSTVDQVGSRLLHRGYGLSNHAWPIHAGLLGNDTLIILDEAHCARPFLDTLTAVAAYRQRAQEPITTPWAFVPMTATPPPGSPEPFRLDGAERQEPLIARRLTARKPAQLRVADGTGDDGMAATILAALRAADGGYVGPGLTTLVVVNRVAVARAVFDDLRRRSAPGAKRKDAFPCLPVLLTGRSRSLERDQLVREHRSRLMAGRERAAAVDQPPLIVVATQCVEVGADLDVDALVTEACPLDSLRQRAGRLDRLGERGDSPALVVVRPEQVGEAARGELPKDLDAVYGDRLTRTWWWLNGVAAGGSVDLGVEALDGRQPPADALSAPAVAAPVIYPAYCDLWVQTGPAPAVSPDPAIFLHGPRSGPAEVGIVWRADLDPGQPDVWTEVLALAPPVAGEVLPVPVHVARAWLGGGDGDPGGDIEGEPAPEDGSEPASSPRAAVRWLGPEQSALIHDPVAVRPGDILVVPCSWGGADRWGWTGQPADRPDDLLERGRIAAHRPAVLRVHPTTTVALWGAQPPPGWQEWAGHGAADEAGLPEDGDVIAAVAALLPTWRDAAPEGDLRTTLSRLVDDGGRIVVAVHPTGTGWVVTGRQRLNEAEAVAEGAPERDAGDEDDGSSQDRRGPVPLAVHLDDVRDWARRIAGGARLPPPLLDALARAGHLHDLGKADPRFQAWLLGGDRLRVDPGRLLAKSDRIRNGAAAQRARERSGYPAGARHELLSVRLAEQAADLLPADPVLRDLVLHMVASHHGRCRPWAPVVADERPITVRVHHDGHLLAASSATGLERIDSGIAERFWRLVRHFGWWGLSYLEACLRLADHRASEHPGTEERP